MKKIILIILVFLFLFSVSACSPKDDEAISLFTLDNLNISVTDLFNQEAGEHTIAYSIDDFNRYKSELDLGIEISVTDQEQNPITIFDDKRIHIQAGKLILSQ